MSAWIIAAATSLAWGEEAPGWSPRSVRKETEPKMYSTPGGQPHGTTRHVISHDEREGLDGWWEQTLPVKGGEWRRFRAWRKTENVAEPRRSALARVVWQDDAGKLVPAAVPEAQAKALGHVPTAEPEHPADGATDRFGWTIVEGVYQVPPQATKAVLELHLQWSPDSFVAWTGQSFEKVDPPAPRRVRLASIHHKPSGKSKAENVAEFAALLAEAARQKADLVVLGETVPSVGLKGKPHDHAEPVPGPSTRQLGELAKAHGLHVATSLYEKDAHLVHNTGVLIGPDGALIGKYRKTCLPHSEVEAGVAPGREYPVFKTKFGMVGLMVCYDGFFPEVARELSKNGAEVIAWPVWGCNPLLAQARACENRVHVVSSTFMAPKDGWMISAVYDQTGTPIARAEAWGSVAAAEVDLAAPYRGPYNLGDFRSMIPRHRPSTPAK